jgi:hypothetical protein
MENCLVGAALIHVDRWMGVQMDGMMKLIGAYMSVQTHIQMHEWD